MILSFCVLVSSFADGIPYIEEKNDALRFATQLSDRNKEKLDMDANLLLTLRK